MRTWSPTLNTRCIGIYSSAIYDEIGHGTHVGGTIAATDNSSGVVGAAFGVDLWSVNIAHTVIVNNVPKAAVSYAEAACAIDLARYFGVRIVNMSFGGGSALTALTDQINGGWNYDNMIFVGSAGNDASGTVTYPASLSNVISVTALDSANARATFANYGSALDLAAPGESVVSTYRTSSGTYLCVSAVCSGTSMAAPHVTSAAAILARRYPAWTNAEIRDRLFATSVDLGSSGRDNSFGYGLVDVLAAITMSATMDGPSNVWEGFEYTWSPIVVAGRPPFTYQWYVDGTPVSTSQGLLMTAGPTSFNVGVVITDYYGMQTGASKSVTVQQCGASPLPPCS